MLPKFGNDDQHISTLIKNVNVIHLSLFLAIFLLINNGGECAKIVLHPHPFVRSQQGSMAATAVELLASGHSVTWLQWPPTGQDIQTTVPPPNGTKVINMYGAYSQNGSRDEVMTKIDWMLWRNETVLDVLDFLWFGIRTGLVWKPMEDMAANPELMETLRRENFDLALVDPIFYAAGWIIMNQLPGVPMIAYSSTIPVYFVDKAAKVPVPFSYCPSIYDAQFPNMTLLGRAKNIFDHYIFTTAFFWPIIELYAQYVIGWTKTENDPVMAMHMDEPMLMFPRPQMNSLVHSLRIRPKVQQPVIDEMINFVSEPESMGTIIFSLTTIGRHDLMASDMRQALLAAFERFPKYRIIWRTSIRPKISSPDSAKHIRFTSWYNQTNVFGHAKTKLLITHGGIASVLEAIRHGIPVLAMPMGVDHYGNTAPLVYRGIGLLLMKRQMSTDSLTEAMRQILDNPHIYEKNAKRYGAMIDTSASLVGNPMLADIERTLKFGNRLKSMIKAKGEYMNSIRYFSIDTIAILVACLYISASP